MLVDLNVSTFTGRRHDREITAEVAQAHGAAADAGRYNKLLIAKAAIAGPEKAANVIRDEHYRYTLPWSDYGLRILPSAAYFDYIAAIGKAKDAFQSVVDDFVNRWPEHVEDARQRLNGMFRQSDYPAQDEIAARFRVAVAFFPLPDAEDFRVSIGEGELQRVRQELQIAVTDRMELATRAVWERVAAVVGRMVERLSVYTVDEETGKVQHPFRDSLISNVRDLAGLLPKLNITDDPALTAMAAELEFRLCQFEPQELRESAAARSTALSAAEAILKKMEGYV